MNWLAHLHLSEPTLEFRVGNLLPDLLSSRELALLVPEFLPGIQQHRRIDAFTDAHPVVRRGIQRLEPPLRRFGGIVIDVFYDHFLALDWNLYSDVPLSEFTRDVYASFDLIRSRLPGPINDGLERMRAGDLLGSYREISGISNALCRIGRRFDRPVALEGAVGLLERDYESLRAEFHAFYPELRASVAGPGRVA